MSKESFEPEKFKVFVRYLIQVAKQKRCVPYKELENLFGLNHSQVGYYSGKLGNYCLSRKIGKLNGLIISSTDCVPSYGYAWYHKTYGKHWGEIVTECWQEFHTTSSKKKQVQDFTKRDKDVQSFLDEE